MEPLDPTSWDVAPPPAPGGAANSGSETPSKTSGLGLVLGAIPILMFFFAMFTGMSTEISARGSWTFIEMTWALAAVIGPGAIVWAIVFVTVRGAGRGPGGLLVTLTVLLTAALYLISAVWGVLIALSISSVRAPADCH